MNDLIIKVSKINKTILPDRTTLGNDGENLQSRLVFKFIDSFVDGIARLEYSIEDEKNYIIMNKENNTYSIPIKNIITKEGNVLFQLVITEPETSEGIPLYKSDVFNLYCKESINAVDEAPEGYELWIEIANQKLMEMEEKIIEVDKAIEKTNNLNITVTKQGTISIIRLTDKDGNVHSVTVNDGTTGNGIESITKTSTSGLVDTYTITYTNGDTTTFDINNGRGITSIVKTSTDDNVDTYTITYNDGTTSTFTVTNGEVTEEQLEEAMQKTLDRANMVYNALPKVEDDGTEITLNGTANTPMQLELNPSELTQETTTGSQLFNAYAINTTGIDVTNDGATITMPIVASGSGYKSTGKKLSVLCPTLQVGDVVYIYFTCTSSNKTIYTTDGTYWTNGATKTITQAMLDETVVLYSNNATQGETSANIYSDLRIVKTQNEPFEKFTYGASPNPNYPQDVQVIKGNNILYIQNKNLFNPQKIISDSNNENVYITQDNNWIRFITGDNRIKYYPRCIKENTQYSFKATVKSGSASTNIISFGVFYADGTREIIATTGTITDTNEHIISGTTAQNKTVLMLVSGATYDRESFIKIDGAELFEGTDTTLNIVREYQSYPFNLPNGMEYCKIGTYEDEFEHDGDKWYLNKYIGKVNIADLTIDEYISIGTHYRARSTVSNILQTSENSTILFSNCFYGSTDTLNANRALAGMMILYKNTNYVYFISDATNSTNFINLMNSLGGNLYYRLSTPTHDEITDTTLISGLNAIEQAVSYDEQTNISQTNTGLPFRIKASAVRSLVNIFDLINGGA